MTYELARALLFTEALDAPGLGTALLHAARDRTSLVRALADHALLPSEELDAELGGAGRYGDEELAPSRRLMAALPAELCARLAALPLRDLGPAVEVAVADVRDRHVAEELSYWLGKEVRLVAASLGAIDAALAAHPRRTSVRPAPSSTAGRTLFGPRFSQAPPTIPEVPRFPHAPVFTDVEGDGLPYVRTTSETPAWGTVVAMAKGAGAVPSQPPGPDDADDDESDPRADSAIDSSPPSPLPQVPFALGRAMHLPPSAPVPRFPTHPPLTPEMRFPSSLPPPLPAGSHAALRRGSSPPGPASRPPLAPVAPSEPLDPLDAQEALSRLREATERDPLVEAVVRAAGVVARRVAVFAVRREGFAGWSCSRGFGERDRLRELTLPLGAPSVLALATAAGSYFGPILPNDAHARLMAVMERATRDVAVLAIKAQGRAALVLLADEMDDTMLGTRYLDEVARAAGEALGTILRNASLAPASRS